MCVCECVCSKSSDRFPAQLLSQANRQAECHSRWEVAVEDDLKRRPSEKRFLPNPQVAGRKRLLPFTGEATRQRLTFITVSMRRLERDGHHEGLPHSPTIS